MFSGSTKNVELQVPLADQFPSKAMKGDYGEEEEKEIEVGLEDEADTTQGKSAVLNKSHLRSLSQ